MNPSPDTKISTGQGAITAINDQKNVKVGQNGQITAAHSYLVTAKRLNKKLAPKHISSFSVEAETCSIGAASGRNNPLKSNFGNITDVMNSRIQEEHASQNINVFGLLCLGQQRCTKVNQKNLQDSINPPDENFDSPLKNYRENAANY